VDYKYQKYLQKKAIRDIKFSNNIPSKSSYDFIVSIPSYAEFDYLFKTLDSINAQDKRLLNKTLVSVVINNSDACDSFIVGNNLKTHNRLIKTNYNFDLVLIDSFSSTKSFPYKKAGVGLARKISIDSVLKYTHLETIICFLDADSITSSNYLNAIKKSKEDSKWQAAVVDFNHLQDEERTKKIIIEYENFLKDTALELGHSGSPYNFVPIGCTMICTLKAYISIGGMNVRKAAEDFYFLQELQKYDKVHFINKVLVFPSSRDINRSYLGTSKRMHQAVNGKLNINNLYYSSDAYKILKVFLKMILSSNGVDVTHIMNKVKDIDIRLYKFLCESNFDIIWSRINGAGNQLHFENQFHKWFDFLKTIKLLKYI